MRTPVLILCAGLLTAGLAGTAVAIVMAWQAFKKRHEIPPEDPRMQFRTTLWPGEGNVVQFRRMKQ